MAVKAKTGITDKMREQLRVGFPDEAYSQHPTKTFLTTLKAMYVLERLNDIFGVGRWTIDIEIIERTSDYVLVQGEFRSLDYEIIIPKQFGGHKTTGKNTEIADGYKSALTDCQSKIASYLEIGIDVFKGKINPPGKTYQQNRPNTTSTQKVFTKAEKAKELPWLNKMQGKDFTPEYLNILEAITEGKIKSLTSIKEHYKFRKELGEELQKLIK